MNEICLSCRKHTKCGRAEHETIGCGYYVPLTEQEWLQTCDTEQLAEWIASVAQKAISIKENNGIVMLESAIWWVEWLKQPHTPKE